jgi:hypothetical protein
MVRVMLIGILLIGEIREVPPRPQRQGEPKLALRGAAE